MLGCSEKRFFKMMFRIILFSSLLYLANGRPPRGLGSRGAEVEKICLTGYMTELQGWVDANGSLTDDVAIQYGIDLSNKPNALPLLHQELASNRWSRMDAVKFLSMARCGFRRIPSIFSLKDNQTRYLCETVEYITFYGNDFEISGSTDQQYDMTMNATQARELIADLHSHRKETGWSSGFENVIFPVLKELDLRKCSIAVLEGNTFSGMSKLENLYLGENMIIYIDAKAFAGLGNLVHLDLSNNEGFDEDNNMRVMTMETVHQFKDLKNLVSLDLSRTMLMQRNSVVLRSLGPKLQKLSLCLTALIRLPEGVFNKTSLMYLDVSGNPEVLTSPRTLRGIEKTLKVLYAEETQLKSMDAFKGLRNLEILRISNNEITGIPRHIASTLESLQVLDLDKNRVSSWFQKSVSMMPNLKLLSLRDNNINVISEEMASDIANISYVAMGNNFMVCNCNGRDIFELAWQNEMYVQDQLITQLRNDTFNDRFGYEIGFRMYNDMIENRKPLVRACEKEDNCDVCSELQYYGNLLLLDYNPLDYQCLIATDGKSVSFDDVRSCSQKLRDRTLEDLVQSNRKKLFLIIIPALLLPAMAFLFTIRRNIRYFLITMRNSAMLGLISKNEGTDETTIFNYDVFVSYCNEDRAWVLDHLLPHVERDCNISVCLHERDFQVGLTILENIVSCMDRSRSIMLILSQRFLLSQWCQFEMHLAQHRLLETRREDLILVLLEEIPRRLRPNTLHYLMLTKTYIVWPKSEPDKVQFWRRLKKSLVTHRHKQIENVSLA